LPFDWPSKVFELDGLHPREATGEERPPRVADHLQPFTVRSGDQVFGLRHVAPVDVALELEIRDPQHAISGAANVQDVGASVERDPASHQRRVHHRLFDEQPFTGLGQVLQQRTRDVVEHVLTGQQVVTDLRVALIAFLRCCALRLLAVPDLRVRPVALADLEVANLRDGELPDDSVFDGVRPLLFAVRFARRVHTPLNGGEFPKWLTRLHSARVPSMVTLILLTMLGQADAGLTLDVPDHEDFVREEESRAALNALNALNGYQKVTWGMSEAQVKKVYPKAYKRDGDLCADEKIAGYPAHLIFAFINKKLARVHIQLDIAKKSLTADDHFQSVRKALVSKYGEPTNTHDGLDDREDQAVWLGEKTLIMLQRDFSLIPLALHYASTEQLDEVEDPSKDAAKDL
jgi:hypothetical protein